VSTRLAAGLVAAVAFLVRLLHVYSYDPIPFSDMAVFADMATRRLTIANLLTPAGYCSYPPGYAFFLKPFYLLFDGVAATRAIQVVQAALGAWTCVLIGRLAARLHSRRAGVVAALIACFYPHYLFYTSTFMSETVFIFAYTAALLLLLRAMARPASGSLYRAGLAISAAALVRPAALSLLPAAALAGWRHAGDVRGRTRALAVVAAGVLTLIGPWAIRNRIAYGRLVLIAPNGAANLAIGNAAEANGGYRALPSFEGGDVERERHWTTEALRFIAGDPWGSLYVTLGRKWQAFWEVIPPWPLYSSNPELFEGEYFFPMPSWRVVFSLGLIGLAPCLRRRGLWIVPASGLAYVLF
jgi:4-amino-4-deoxy-L-arabinose transferase-like glycosyltransferase